jgi:hypothetical protein
MDGSGTYAIGWRRWLDPAGGFWCRLRLFGMSRCFSSTVTFQRSRAELLRPHSVTGTSGNNERHRVNDVSPDQVRLILVSPTGFEPALPP